MDVVAYAVAGAVVILFGAWLLYLSPRQRATRALATLLFSIGFLWAQDLLHPLLPPSVHHVLSYVVPMVLMSVGLSSIYFLSVYPRPRGWLGRSRHGALALVAIAAALGVALVAMPSAFTRTEIVDGQEVTVETGPLLLVTNAWTVATGLMLVVFAMDARRTPPGPIRRALLLVLAGFLASSTVWSLSLLLNDVSGRLDPRAIAGGYTRAAYIIDEAALLLPLAAAAIVIAHGWRSGLAESRREALAFLALLAVCVSLTAGATFLAPPPGPKEWSSPAQGVVDSAAGVAIAAFAGYALLKHRLFDIDVRLRWTISRGAVAGVFLSVFFVAAQLAQNFLSESYGWMLGGVIAGLMLFAIAPIQRVAERVAHAAVPEARGLHGAPHEQRMELYKMALALALADRAITRDEERHLARLAEELGLGHSETLAAREAMETETAAAPGAA